MIEQENVAPVIFGEVLFDRFSDGSEVLGGAPFNVAWNLKGFGLDPLLISRVGVDKDGETVLSAMGDWGLSVAGVQKDSLRPTGAVDIKLTDTGHTFDILPDQAYDQIDRDEALKVVEDNKPSILCHGTLALRNEISQSALWGIRSVHRPETLVDVNLRAPWWNRKSVEISLVGVNHLKLNGDEFSELSGADTRNSEELRSIAEQFREERNYDSLLVTLGRNGALLADDDGVTMATAPTIEKLVDTVGAGDAVTSVMIVAKLYGWSTDIFLRRALEFASSVCSIRGAITHDKKFYQRFSDEWR